MSGKSCSICLQVTPNLVSLSAGDLKDPHDVFHPDCINKWIHQQRINQRGRSNPLFTCPLCRSKITHVNGVEILPEEVPPLLTAVRSRNIEAIRRVVSRGVQGISQEVYYQTLNEARENAEMLRVLLTLMLPQEETLEHFSSLGFLGVVRVLLENREPSETSRSRAVVLAAKRGHGEVLRTLLANGSISKPYRGKAVVLASSRGDLATVQALLDNGPISREHRNKAHIWASRHGHEDIVQVLSGEDSPS